MNTVADKNKVRAVRCIPNFIFFVCLNESKKNLEKKNLRQIH